MRILIDINLDNHVYFHFGQNLIALQLYKFDFLFVVLSILSILKIFMRLLIMVYLISCIYQYMYIKSAVFVS